MGGSSGADVRKAHALEMELAVNGGVVMTRAGARRVREPEEPRRGEETGALMAG